MNAPVIAFCSYACHHGLAEINAPVGPQEVMPLLKDSPLKTISSCELRVWQTTSCGPTGALISANPG